MPAIYSGLGIWDIAIPKQTKISVLLRNLTLSFGVMDSKQTIRENGNSVINLKRGLPIFFFIRVISPSPAKAVNGMIIHQLCYLRIIRINVNFSSTLF